MRGVADLNIRSAGHGRIGILQIHRIQQAELLDIQRRLSAERAYLRHPDQIARYARDQLGMVPMTPELVQEIRLKEVPPPPEPVVLAATADGPANKEKPTP